MKAEKSDNIDELFIDNYNNFRKSIKIILDDIVTKLYDDNKQLIKVKKSDQSIHNLKRIINTAISISNKKGYSAMSMRELSHASSLSIGALYSYFPSKDELLHIIQQYGRAAVEKTLSGALSNALSTKDKLYNFIHAHIFISEALRTGFIFHIWKHDILRGLNIIKLSKVSFLQNH